MVGNPKLPTPKHVDSNTRACAYILSQVLPLEARFTQLHPDRSTTPNLDCKAPTQYLHTSTSPFPSSTPQFHQTPHPVINQPPQQLPYLLIWTLLPIPAPSTSTPVPVFFCPPGSDCPIWL
ncbi:hypothetical protein PGT21_008813 [Puccinia graminis f. sp. tritici]|uniref:Uncharacterized protein n=1 Tax=Puccinia graminis f. sp. tritici TaxID=56615 RepID=A0A5B0QVY2_PUCGR|nr:hypothetical protein PGT21_008813 [Puccinia graminis f. sp. tritici]